MFIMDSRKKTEKNNIFRQKFELENNQEFVNKFLKAGLSIDAIYTLLKNPQFIKRAELIYFSLLCPDKRIVSLRNLVANIRASGIEEIVRPATPELKIKHIVRNNNKTLRRLSILASLWGIEPVPIEEISCLSGLSERRLRDALKSLEKGKLIGVTLIGNRKYYGLTDIGVIFFHENLSRTFLQSQLPSPFGKRFCRNVRVTLIGILDQAKLVTKELVKMGWWYRSVRTVFQYHSLEFILTWIGRVKGMNLEKPGAYLWVILVKDISDQQRHAAMAKKILAEFDLRSVQIFMEEAATMTCRQALRFALSIRKRSRICLAKDWNFTYADIVGIAGWVRKNQI